MLPINLTPDYGGRRSHIHRRRQLPMAYPQAANGYAPSMNPRASSFKPFSISMFNEGFAPFHLWDVMVWWNNTGGQTLTALQWGASNVWTGSTAVSPFEITNAMMLTPSAWVLNSGGMVVLSYSFSLAYVTNGSERMQECFLESPCPILDTFRTNQLP